MNDIASKPGKYIDFSGEIWYGFTMCEVKNANFELLKEVKSFKDKFVIGVVFTKGDIVDGKLWHTDVEKCGVCKAKASHCVFRRGTFMGDLESSCWYGGTWQGNVWVENTDKFGRIRNLPPTKWNDEYINKHDRIANKAGEYNDFSGRVVWKKSDFEVRNATFELVENPNNQSSVFVDKGTIIGGLLVNVTIYDCNFENGKFRNSVFKGGTWLDGHWILSEWLGGFDKHGTYHEKFDEPNGWFFWRG